MVKPYSVDLRERVVARVMSGKPIREVAAVFGVSVASVAKWSLRFRAFLKPGDMALPDGLGAAGRQGRGMFEIQRVIGPKGHEGLNIMGIIGVELFLDDLFHCGPVRIFLHFFLPCLRGVTFQLWGGMSMR